MGARGLWVYHLIHDELRSDGGDQQRRVDGKAGRDADGKGEV